ncbi:Polyunsaturated Fatty Acid Lipoxygenase Alox15 [Manis pentadactyla]|nr:Polyunsaturated Fatty Acid Lipoxygenase Alox15 [Manis pentadactyla]
MALRWLPVPGGLLPRSSYVEGWLPISLASRAQLCLFVTMCIFTCTGQRAATHLGQVALGQHQEEYFSGPWPQAVLKQFQEEPAALGKEVEVWNTGLDLPYEELGPSLVEKCDPLRAFPLGPKALPSLSSSEYRSSLAPSSGDRLSPQLCGQGARSCCLTQPQGIHNRWFPLKSAT